MSVFFLGSWGMNRSAGQTNRVNRDTHSLIEHNIETYFLGMFLEWQNAYMAEGQNPVSLVYFVSPKY